VGARGRTREGNGGGVGSVPRGGRETEEREGPGRGGRQHGVKDAAANSPRPLGASDGTVALTGESGGAQATRCCVTDMQGQVASGSSGSGRGT
jgi:hypothetical protein